MSDEVKRKLLIADDTPANIKVLGEALRHDYKIIVATNGLEVLKIMESGSLPDLILLDVMMPDMDGYETCKRLKANALTAQIPIIFITAKSQEDDEAYGFKLGAVDYITKPISIPILKARVNTHMELKRHRDALVQMARIDGLTGVSNRLGYNDFMDMEWRRACRNNLPISLIMIDIDYFKQYNDSYGHIMGDECLKRVATALASLVRRPGDLVARYGGEEFAAILPDTDRAGVQFIAEKMRKCVESLKIDHCESSVGPHVTVSIGCFSVNPNPGEQPEELASRADKALYSAKKCGRNRVIEADSEGE
ncbi:MAG: diguanylate cyclase [Pseudomonadales bacterium]|nr:diguanylate cyclase [Pseudomonadales bacterium]